MKSRYTKTGSAVILLFCLFIITSASSSSFIQQVTDDFTTNLQLDDGDGPDPIQGEAHYFHTHVQDGDGPDPIQGEAHYLHNHDQEVSSRDYKVSASNAIVKGLRSRPPSSYSLKMESFNTLLKSKYSERYVSRPFSAAGYNWTLVVYPNGNKNDKGSGYLSLYAAIDNSTLAPHEEVYVDLRFYVFNKKEKKYFTIQDTDVWRYNNFKTMWGFSQVLPGYTFKSPYNGYLYDGDHCEFGVDVTTPTVFQTSELFTVANNFKTPTFTWRLLKFSTLLEDTYLSDTFSIGGRRWNIQVNPSGRDKGKGKALSMYLIVNHNEELRPFERIYVRAKLRVLNKFKFRNVERQIDNWFSRWETGRAYGWGSSEFVPLSNLKDSSKGFLVDDKLTVQVEIEAVSTTKYFPS
ncbi:uncharacterized protein LOC103869330 [Brassica rapa]|uniref:BnaA05g18690D protein n=4 Tax=Brassica TaxID=3705 RepID=A0A078GG13_BRANA|nr:uncharacterized protein LOC103869330 [Brassica rapa]XP_013652616.2 uncharacterized protein LOC106357500 [Brassica napus]KAH0926787.1 hypothetical protein HID58_019043 [Brassica napus]CAF2099830.1 unnamed protein product [Brassica napus]CDY25415.1 BnaA05g18690D [Brassica napus]